MSEAADTMEPGAVGRAVLLRHVVPDGTEHFDWLFERAPGAGGLLAFRVMERLDLADVAMFIAERIGDHRREYLAYEGPVSGNRGEVRRLAEGRSVLRVETERVITVDQDWGGGWWRLTGERISAAAGESGAEIWRFLSTRLGWRDDAEPGML